MRTNTILEKKMYDIWEAYFNDVPRKNLVLIKFGRKAKRQLGSIKWVTKRTRVKSFLKNKKELQEFQDDERITLITITSYFKNTEIPDYVVDTTIAHEVVHYAHGFFSPLKKVYNYPHQGGVVRKKLSDRGMKDDLLLSKDWLDKHWLNFIKAK